MQNSRLGCFSLTGIIAAVVTALAIGGVVYARGGLLYNPGPLNAQAGERIGDVTSHAEIGGECEACHTAPWDSTSMAERCTDCHGEIGRQMQDIAQLHGAMYERNPKLLCLNCHPEHRGADAPLTVMAGGEFPHQVLGYSLDGHRQKVDGEAFTCDDCHNGDITTFASDSCEACHRQMDIAFTQAHLLSYGTACLECHDGVDRLGEDFRHDRFTFNLTGAHEGVACVKCHVDARTYADLQATAQGCYACHFNDDPHEARFGTDCAACHTVDGWKPAKFDHNLSDFKLIGEHAEVRCEECHQGGNYKDTPQECYACHQQDDEHNGNFGTDCAACHTPEDWENVTFDHALSNFPLTGAHVNVACEDCHKNAQFAGLSTVCVACHEDPSFHAGAFGTSCADCHNVTAWTPAKYFGSHPGIADEGGSGINHGRTTCQTCHPSSVYNYTCLACHDSNNPDDDGGDDGDDD